MSTTYAQKQATAQKKDAPTAASILDTSSQSESLQRKADMANSTAQREATPRPNNTGMPDNLKAGIESLSGFSMDDVRVHYNSSKPATVQALAYTQGTDIHVAPGQEKHLPHEAWHVVQQMAGRVSPTTNINGMPVNDNAGLEHEADVMGEKATQSKNVGQIKYKYKQYNNIVQCLGEKEIDDDINKDKLMSNIIKILRSKAPRKGKKSSRDGDLEISRENVQTPTLDPNEPDAKKIHYNKMNRDHIIPLEGLANFLSHIYKNWEYYKKNDCMRNWIATALETFFKNNSKTLSTKSLNQLLHLIRINSEEMLKHEYIQSALLWMPGNIFLSWRKYGSFTPPKDAGSIEESFDEVPESEVGRVNDETDGTVVDDYAERIIGNEALKKYRDVFKRMQALENEINKGNHSISSEIVFKTLTEIAKGKLTITKKEDWISVSKKGDWKSASKKGEKYKYMSLYQPRIPDGFTIQDCGSDGNNCLLLSLGVNGDFNEIRRQVMYYEESLELRYARTNMTNFLNPGTLFPVLQRMRLLFHQVWIYDAATGRWIHWNGQNLRFNDIPSRSSYHSTQIFLFYNGVNHYQRLVPNPPQQQGP